MLAKLPKGPKLQGDEKEKGYGYFMVHYGYKVVHYVVNQIIYISDYTRKR